MHLLFSLLLTLRYDYWRLPFIFFISKLLRLKINTYKTHSYTPTHIVHTYIHTYMCYLYRWGDYLWTAPTNGPTFHPADDTRVWWSTVQLYWHGKTKELEEKPVPVPLCSSQISYGLTRARTRASTVKGRRLTAWVMAWPKSMHTYRKRVYTYEHCRRRGVLPIC
jgi:hypothetical protein